MKYVAVLTIVLAMLGCSGKSANSQGDFTVATAFSPDPPKEGRETLTITLTDPSGAPVKGADVTITTAMASMSMTGPTITAHDNGDGTYTAEMGLQYATTWTFTITAKNGTKSARSVLTQNVGSP